MLTKAIVEKIINPYSVKVRIPIYDGASSASLNTPTDELSTATICTLPNVIPNLQLGDIVFVGFEDNDTSKPIVLGHLARANATSTAVDLILKTLKVDVATCLPEQTTIGNTTAQDLKNLSKTKGNIQSQIDLIIQQLNNAPSGKVITDVVITYQTAGSGTSPPTGTWLSYIPETLANEYLWTRMVTTYSDDTTSTAYSVGAKGEDAYYVDIVSSNGNIFKNGIINTVLSAVVYEGQEDVTDNIDANRFRWTRASSDAVEDSAWNSAHFSGTKQIQITRDDVNKRASFTCKILKE